MKILPITGRAKKLAWFLKLDVFKGLASLLDDVILGKQFAKEALNLLQVQDGRWKTRWGTAEYGQTLNGSVTIVACGKYVTSANVQEKIAIGSDGKAYKSTDQGAWSEITGATFDTSAEKYSFEQYENVFFICNGVDRLTRYAGSTLARYTPLSAPTGLSASRNVLTAGSNNNYYQVTALNEVGESIASAEYPISTNKHRNSWIQSSSEYLTLSWSPVVGAIRYQIYWSDTTGKELLLAETSTTTTSFIDDGSYVQNPYVTAPTQDSTGAPAFKMVAESGSRLWGITDEYVWWSGVAPYVGYFSDAFGGGYQPLGAGSGERLEWVGHFRDGKGTSVATVLTVNKEGLGTVWQVPLEVTTIADTTIIVPNPTKIPGPIGTMSMNGVVDANDSLYIPNSRGIFSLNNKANITNILSTGELSGNIRPSYENLLDIDMMAGIWYDSKVIFSGSESGNGNDMMFGLDTERGEWFWKWTIGFRSFLEVTESDGVTHLLGVPNSGTKLVEISPNIRGDLGQPFYQSWISGLIPVSEDPSAFANVQESGIELGRPTGTIYFEVLGVERKRGFSALASRQITDSVSNIDFTNGLFDEYMFEEDDDTPRTYSQASVKKTKRVGRVLNAIQFHVYSETADTEFTILSLWAKGFIERLRTPSNWFK